MPTPPNVHFFCDDDLLELVDPEARVLDGLGALEVVFLACPAVALLECGTAERRGVEIGGRPPFLPFKRAASLFAREVLLPPILASSRIHSFVPKIFAANPAMV